MKKTGKKSTYFFHYIQARKRLLILVSLWVTVFFVLFALSGISIYYVWYPTLICAVLFLCYAVLDIRKFVKKHWELMQVMGHVDVTLENLPTAENQIEKDYQQLLEKLLASKNESLCELKTSRKETTEVMTLWTHQIKTPLTALGLLASEIDETVRKEMLTRLFEIEQYGDMMLQYLRLEGDGTDYVLKEYSVKQMVNQSVRYFARIFISKGIVVKNEVPGNMVIVTDEKWMVFALKQLISNALKYTIKGSVTIWVEGTTLVIEDTGIGIVPEDLPRIFERGYTGYNGRKNKKATGLGLFLTKRILSQLGHEIRVTSQVNEGTRVEVNLK